MRRYVWLVGVLVLGVLANLANAITFDVSLDAASEIPAPNVTGFTPSGTATVDVNTITGVTDINGSFTGLTGNAVNAHLHGLTDPNNPTASPIFGLTFDAATSGNISGSDTLSAANLAGLLDGRTYLNIHTANNGPGEIRGDVVDSDIKVFQVTLDAASEMPHPKYRILP